MLCALLTEPFKLQSCIEKCLQEQLTMAEACTTIYYQFAIDPRVTEIGMWVGLHSFRFRVSSLCSSKYVIKYSQSLTVWRKLEEENPTYFKEYTNRLQQQRAAAKMHPSIF